MSILHSSPPPARVRRAPAPGPWPGLAIAPPRVRARIREAFARLLPLDPALERHLRGVVADTLAHPGSLARAQLAYVLGTRLGLAPAAAMKIAIAVEYYHAASLIFDDMPAMDGAVLRRGRPCPHLVHGEGAAILGALALITRAYALVWEALTRLPPRRRRAAAALLAESLGVSGILDGQAHDLHFRRDGAAVRDVERVAAAKTVPLLRLAIVLPALAGGAGRPALERLERLCAAWGLAYQILDDFKDVVLSPAEAGKSTDRDALLQRPNLPCTAGEARARASLDAQLAAARRELAALPQAAAARWATLRSLQEALEEARAALARRLSWAGPRV